MGPLFASSLLAALLVAPPTTSNRGSDETASPTRTSARVKPSRTLPLRRLRLYEAGVGYFERSGPLDGARDARLPLPVGHVDDALKTLVVLDDADGRVQVSGVRFASSVGEGMARALAGLPLADDGDLDHGKVLGSLVGLDVEVTHAGGRILRGRVLEVLGPFTPVWADDAKRAIEEVDVEPRWTLITVGEDGRVSRLSSEDIEGITPLDADVAERLRLAAAALAERSAQQPKPLSVRVSGRGTVRVGYVAEAPLWRTSHRLVFRRGARESVASTSRPESPKPRTAAESDVERDTHATLQSWALVHNDTDEDWRDLSLELVSGRPTSFVFPLAAPRYAHRELATPEHALPTVPQMAVATADAMWGDHLEGIVAGYGSSSGSLGISGYGHGGGGSASGAAGLGRIGVGHVVTTESGAGPSLGDLAAFARAEVEGGSSLFAYRVRVPVDVAAHHSALVPLVQTDVAATRITWVGLDDVAAAGVRLVNDTPQTLPEGTLAIYDEGGFVGETALDRLRPGERRFLMHGQDLDVELTRAAEHVAQEIRDVTWKDDGLLVHELVTTRHSVYATLHGEFPRTLVIALPVPRGAELDETSELDWDHESETPLLVIPDAPAGELARTLVARHVTIQTQMLSSLGVDVLDDLIGAVSLPEEKRALLADARDEVAALEQLRVDALRRDQAIERLRAEAKRLREHVGAIGAAHDTRAGRKLADRLLASEARLAELELERAEAEDVLEEATAAARAALEAPGSASAPRGAPGPATQP